MTPLRAGASTFGWGRLALLVIFVLVVAVVADQQSTRPATRDLSASASLSDPSVVTRDPSSAGHTASPATARPTSTPTPKPSRLETARRVGKIAFADPSHGDDYLAIPIGPGRRVRICGPAACWVTRSTDAGPNRERLQAGRIADVALIHWLRLCGADRQLSGLCDGWWSEL